MRMPVNFCLFAAVAVTLPASADIKRFEWQPVPQAYYYEGALNERGQEFQVRTRGTWLLLDDTSELHLEAVTPTGLVPVTITSKPLEMASPAAENPPEQGQSIQGQSIEEMLAEPADAGLEEKDAADLPFGNETASGSVATTASPAVVAANGTVSLHLGMGKEWLKAKGGASDYVGDANIGGTTIEGEWYPVGDKWSAAAQIGAHNYTSDVTETIGAQAIQSSAKFLRITARAAAFYEFNRSARLDDAPSYRLAVGLGLSYFRLPLLTISDSTSGKAGLELKSGFGPYLGVNYARYLSISNALGTEIDYLPTTLQKSMKGMSSNILLYWRHAFVRSLFLELSMRAQHDKLATGVDCPAVQNCTSTSTASSDLLQGRLGLGYRF